MQKHFYSIQIPDVTIICDLDENKKPFLPAMKYDARDNIKKIPGKVR